MSILKKWLLIVNTNLSAVVSTHSFLFPIKAMFAIWFCILLWNDILDVHTPELVYEQIEQITFDRPTSAQCRGKLLYCTLFFN